MTNYLYYCICDSEVLGDKSNLVSIEEESCVNLGGYDF